ncbi:GNAT family N-acetyltransferase [Dehalobacter sp. DCM]|uniref:GNAT family N-acetyltransferase n=1 Tax=Dehalobacter sp. DCM TaxID=2907827 RepID=UPI003081226E|nr:GNAT family N-acetyltransferase [Dehalobacter sp. DCM]
MIVFANQGDEEALREILLEYDMDISGDIEDHIVIKDKTEIMGGAKIGIYDHRFYLEVFGVKSDSRGQGLGGILLSELIKHPWKYCAECQTDPLSESRFIMTTVARGTASGFYKTYGFESCSFSEIPEPFRDQCDFCPTKDDCNPIPMIYFGGY